MPPGLAEELRAQAPAFEHVTSIQRPTRTLVAVGQDALFLDDVAVTDAAFFDVFPHPFLQGNPATALQGPGRLVLTASASERLFGDADPMGRTIRIDNHGSFHDFTVVGVIADPPSYTHLRFSALRSSAPGEASGPEGGLQWNYYANAVYGVLRPGVEAADAEAQVVALERATNTQEWMQDQVSASKRPRTSTSSPMSCTTSARRATSATSSSSGLSPSSSSSSPASTT